MSRTTTSHRKPARLALIVVGLAAAGTSLTACNTTGHVKKADVENQVSTQLAKQIGQTPKSVVCDSDLPGKVGASERCLLTATDGSSIGLTVTVTSVKGSNVQFSAQVDQSVSNGPSASATPDDSSSDGSSTAPDDGSDSSSDTSTAPDDGSGDDSSSTAPDDGSATDSPSS